MEATQPGNPHGLTINQHVFPRSAIRRFCGIDGRVQVAQKATGQTFRASPSATIFCAQRVWSDGIEHGFMLRVENDYRWVAEKYAVCSGTLLSPEAQTVSEMYFLWNARHAYRKKPDTPIQLAGITATTAAVDVDLEEKCEKMDVVTCRPDATIAARSIWGAQTMMRVDACILARPNLRWVCLQFANDLIVPDNFAPFPYLPLTPNRAFIGTARRHTSAEELNRLSKEAAEEYWFCR